MSNNFPQTRKQALHQTVQIVIDKITSNGGLIDSNTFDGVMNHFQDLIFDGQFSKENRYGTINSFLSEFKAKLKKSIYLNFPHLKDIVESNIDDFVVELDKNTKLFMKKNLSQEKKITRLFHVMKHTSIKSSSPKVRINRYAELLYQHMTRHGLRVKSLDDILLVEGSIEKLIHWLVNHDKILPTVPRSSEEQKEKAIDELTFKFKQQIEKRKQNYYNRISLAEKHNEEKVASRQEKYEAKTMLFVERFIDECKLKNLHSRSDINKFIVTKLRAKNIFTQKSLSIMAPMILNELQKQPSIFPDFQHVFITDFLYQIRLQDEAIDLQNHEFFGQPKRQAGFLGRLGFKRKSAVKLYHNFDALKQDLLKRVDNQEFTYKDMLNIYVPELIDELTVHNLLKLPAFETAQKRTDYINNQKQDILQAMSRRIFDVRKKVINDTLNDIASEEKFATFDSVTQLTILVDRLRNHKLFQGRLHYGEIEKLIIERVWGLPKEIDTKQYKKVRNKYRQILLNSYEKTTNQLQFKLRLSNKIGLGFSMGSASIGIFGLVALLSSTVVLPVIASIPILAVCAIITSGSGLAMSNYANRYTKSKEIAQDIIDKTIDEDSHEVSRELFKNMPTVGELVMGLFHNNGLKTKTYNDYHLYFKFVEHLRNLDQDKIRAIIHEIGAEYIDLTTPEGKKQLFISLIDHLKESINSKIDYYESKTKTNALRSLQASLGTFALGTLITSASIITEAATGAPIQSTSALGQSLGWAGAAITATGGVSIANAYMLNHTKEHFSGPLINLRTNLNLLSSYVEQEQAHIYIPDNICKAYRLDPNIVNQKVTKAEVPVTHTAEPIITPEPAKKPSSFVDKLGLKKNSQSFVEQLSTSQTDDPELSAQRM